VLFAAVLIDALHPALEDAVIAFNGVRVNNGFVLGEPAAGAGVIAGL
jgi:hypothetical protein